MSRTSMRSWLVALATLYALAASGPAAGESFITFAVQEYYDTNVSAINAGGAVTGAACGDDFCYGYVRAADGTITTFNGPALVTGGTAINRKGTIAGVYFDNNPPFAGHGFLRKPGGKFISFDPAGSTDTEVFAINDSGVITGYYNTHGFLRAADGSVTTFDPTGSTATVPTAINANGDIAGYYFDSLHTAHGFLRMADGTITPFAVKHAKSTQAYGINSKDAIVGYYYIYPNHTIGFERTPRGRIRTFDFEGSTGTMVSGINDKGQITGYYDVTQQPYAHGFVGSPKSGFTSFDVPNKTYTQPTGINDKGDITGSYGGEPISGFIRMP